MKRAVWVVLVCALAVGSAEIVKTERTTAELMEQVLAAVSTPSDGSVMEKLCAMINDVDRSVEAMSEQEQKDLDAAIAHLSHELSSAHANMTQAMASLNSTLAAERAHNLSAVPLPTQLGDAKSREEALIAQRNQLSAQCQQELEGQYARVDAVKSDVSALDEALAHLTHLDKSREGVSLIQVGEGSSDEDGNAVIRCRNGWPIRVNDSAGLLVTAPPGNGMSYHTNLECKFVLSATNAHEQDRVQLSWTQFDSLHGQVKVYDGEEEDEERLLGTFKGTSLPPSVRSRISHQMTVVYQNSHPTDQGFVAAFKTVRIPINRNSAINQCATAGDLVTVLTGDSGAVAEDSRALFASALPTDAARSPSNCRWLVQGKEGETLRLHFTFVNTSRGVEELTVFDGSSSLSSVALRVNGVLGSSVDVVSTSNALFITLSTLGNGQGFHTTWCVVGRTCSPTAPIAPIVMPPVPPLPTVQSKGGDPPCPPPEPEVEREDVAPTHEGTCCPSDCHHRGVCSPTTCTCVCEDGDPSDDCSLGVHDDVLLDLGNGVGSEVDEAGHLERDECGDMVDLDDGQVVRELDLDPIANLLRDLKSELHQSLQYEHSAANFTSNQCNEELRQVDRDLERLQQDVLMLGKSLADANARATSLQETREALALSVKSLRDFASELSHRIQTKRALRQERLDTLNEEKRTLQSMRDMITHMGGYQCTATVQAVATFNKTENVECTGAAFGAPHVTSVADDCKIKCGAGCQAFVFNPLQGCRFLAAVDSRSAPCANGAPTCACYERR